MRLRRLRCLTRNFVIYGLFAEQLLKLTNLLEGIAQIRRWHNFFAGTDCRQTAILIQLAPMEQLVGIDTVPPCNR
ncbi:hypothetical protein M218_09530 [Burkholderia pseudomallei MSHR338]|nr:hypothetical protein M218_09530 [Burkholderia pseudomallei MSHR338]